MKELEAANERRSIYRKRMEEVEALEGKYLAGKRYLCGVKVGWLSLAARNMTDTYRDTYGASEEKWRHYLRVYEILLRAFSEADKEGESWAGSV